MSWQRILLTLCFVAGMWWWFAPVLQQPETVKPNSDTYQPDYQAQGITRTWFNSQGQLEHQITADTMEYYLALDMSQFTAPKVTYVTKAGDRYQMQAQEGTLYPEQNVLMQGNVRIEHFDAEQKLSATIQGRDFDFNLQTRQLLSKQPVIIDGSNWHTEGSGLRLDTEQQHLTLTNHTKTSYVYQNQ